MQCLTDSMAEFLVAVGCESPCHPASSLSVCQTGLHSLGGLAVEAAFAAFLYFQLLTVPGK